MCLVALAIDQSRRFPLVVASNRDEYFKRPSASLAWWAPKPGDQAMLSGRDDRAANRRNFQTADHTQDVLGRNVRSCQIVMGKRRIDHACNRPHQARCHFRPSGCHSPQVGQQQLPPMP